MSGNTVYCYPDTQLLVYRACQLCHALLASLGLAPPGHMVSVSRLKLAFVLMLLLARTPHECDHINYDTKLQIHLLIYQTIGLILEHHHNKIRKIITS